MAEDGSVEFFGQSFALPDRLNARRINQLAVLGKQAAAADKRGDSAAASLINRDYMALVEALFVQSVRPEDRERMDALCDEAGPADEDLMAFVGEVAAGVAQRPTRRSSDSSAGPTSTPPRSESGSGDSVVSLFEREGRPDKAWIVKKSQEARSA